VFIQIDFVNAPRSRTAGRVVRSNLVYCLLYVFICNEHQTSLVDLSK